MSPVVAAMRDHRRIRSFPSITASCRSPFSPTFFVNSPSRFQQQQQQQQQFSFSSFPASSDASSLRLAFNLNSDNRSIVRDKPQQILVIVDATKEVTTDSLAWTLDLVARPGDTVTFAGILPWLCLPMLVKRWSELRTIDERSCTTREGDVQLKSAEFLRIQSVYKERGVNLEIIIESGYPPRDVAVKLALKFDAKWIICYRCLNKKIDQSLLFQKLGGKNIVFLKSKDEGSVSFAAKTPTLSPMSTHGCAVPGFCSPQSELGDLSIVDKESERQSHITIGECLKNKNKT